MKVSRIRLTCLLATVLIATLSFAQGSGSPVLKTNQTLGYGGDQLLNLTYTQSFDCVDQVSDDLNFNGIPSGADPGEFQVPICQLGIQPTQDPTGLHGSQDQTEPLYVLVPMFSLDNDQNPGDAISCTGVVAGTNCGAALGNTLITLFGNVPEAFKAKPLVYTQCPDPGLPAGTCTMHSSRVDLGLALVQLGKLPPPAANYFAPLPNHSHVLLNSDLTQPPIWWEVVPVLVFNSSDWPNADGTNGITSFSKLQAAEKSGDAVQVPSNFFLFFSSNKLSASSMNHDHMH